MADKGRYVRALGLDSDHRVRTDLTPEGALTWGVSKTPAVAGGLFADWVYEWAAKKWPNSKRGPEFVGGVCVVVGAYGLSVLATRYQPTASHLVEKMTDGMIGRISPVVVHLFRSLFDDKKQPAAPGAAAGRALPAGQRSPGAARVANGISLDGDREAVMDVANLLYSSPETTQAMAEQMFQLMRRDGHDIDEGGRQAVATSMREVAGQIAAGRF